LSARPETSATAHASRDSRVSGGRAARPLPEGAPEPIRPAEREGGGRGSPPPGPGESPRAPWYGSAPAPAAGPRGPPRGP